MAITYTEYGTGSVWNAISPQTTIWSSVKITSIATTEVHLSINNGADVYSLVAFGNYNLSALPSTPTTVADIVSNAAFVNGSTVNSVQQFTNGSLRDVRTYSPASSMYNDLNLDTTLAVDNAAYAGHDFFYSSSGNSAKTNHDTIFGYTG